MSDEKSGLKGASVQQVRDADVATNTFDGQKADLYLNTGKLGGKTFLVTVHQPDGKPVLIAVHL